MTKLLLLSMLSCCAYGQSLFTISNLTIVPYDVNLNSNRFTLEVGSGHPYSENGFFKHQFISGYKFRSLYFQNDFAPLILIYLNNANLLYAQPAECYPRPEDGNSTLVENFFEDLSNNTYIVSYQCAFIAIPPALPRK